MEKAGYQERQFGRVVGGVLVLVALWQLWRGRTGPLASTILVIGAALVVLSFLAPAVLRYPSRVWMALAGALGWVSTRVILALVFFGVMTPIGVVKRLLGWDPLRRRSLPQQSYWHPYPRRHQDPRHFEKMY